jgi:hypothetical protein
LFKARDLIVRAILMFSALTLLSPLAALDLNAQGDNPTPIPVVIQTSTPLPLPGNAVQLSPTPTPTVTPANTVFVEALSTANVRADADPAAEILGIIEAGTQYPVVGRYFQWYWMRYDRSPSGRGWVHESVVNLVGDASLVRDLSEDPEPTTDPEAVAATQTWEAITLTPGVVLTATASARIISGPVPVNSDPNAASASAASDPGNGGQPGALPTFTPPPELLPNTTPVALTTAIAEGGLTVAPPTPSPDPLIETTAAIPSVGSIAPIVPIGVLAGLGLLGLAVSASRR